MSCWFLFSIKLSIKYETCEEHLVGKQIAFRCNVWLEDEKIANASETSKKKAEEKAAQRAFYMLNKKEQIIEKQKDNPFYPYHLHEQKEIDKLVYKLYGLSDEDIREVEIWYCRRYQKLAEAQGMLAEVREKYADYLALCEQNLDQQVTDISSNQNVKTSNLTTA